MIYHGHTGQLDDLPQTVRRIAERLKPHKTKFDCIVATGLSGVLVAAPTALRLHKPLAVLRKPSDNCHTSQRLLNAAGLIGNRYLFIDDFISLGETYDGMRRYLSAPEFCAQYAGTYLYCDDVLSWRGDGKISWHPSAKERFARVRVDYCRGPYASAA